MSKLITTICLLLLLFPPISALASESPATAETNNLIPIHFFGDKTGGILTIAPIEENLFIWVYSQTNKTNPHAVTTAGSTIYTYDDNGNLTGDGTYTYTWDYNNRLASSTNGGTTYNYYYDNEGNRIKKVNGSNTTIYVNQYYEIDPSGKIRRYGYGSPTSA